MINKIIEKFESMYRDSVNANTWNAYMQKYIFKRYAKRCFKESYKLLEVNKKYKDMYKGRRCFILGNGPSLKKQDLSFLKDEIVMTVNQAARSAYFESIRTNFHFIADPQFFELDCNKQEDQEVLDAICNINKGNNYPVCFTPIQFRNFMVDNDLENKLNTAYFNPSLTLCEGYDMDIDFCKFIPGSNTVVHYAIMFAIYTGVSEIIILGCECTLLMRDIQELLNMPVDTYSYEMTKNEMKRLKKEHNQKSFIELMEGNMKVFKQYKYLYEYCNKKGIRLYNATPQTLLDTVPRVNLDTILR